MALRRAPLDAKETKAMDRPRPTIPEPILGGDPACWLDLVCDACGQVRDGLNDDVCPTCTPRPHDDRPPHGESG